MKDLSARELKGHDILAVERFKDNTKHMIEFIVLATDTIYGNIGDEKRLFSRRTTIRGLISMMLSLPDNWNYAIQGFAKFNSY